MSRPIAMTITEQTGEVHTLDLDPSRPWGEQVGHFLVENLGWQMSKTITVWVGQVNVESGNAGRKPS